MCSINHELKAIFIHIPKTGGLYIKYILEKYYGFTTIEEKNGLPEYFNKNYNNTFEENMLTITHKGIFRYFTMSPYLSYLSNMNNDKWNDYYKFTFVRNPYDRLFSAWKYLKKINLFTKSFKEFAFLNFNDYNYDNLNLNKIYFHSFITEYDHIINKYKLLDINYIGKFENLNNDLIFILHQLGIKEILHMNEIKLNVKINESNIYENNTKIQYYNYYDDTLLNKVNQVFFNDFRFFNYKIYNTQKELILSLNN